MLKLLDIREMALAVGFDDCGVARAMALDDEEFALRQWLSEGKHGELGYMERNIEKRMDPRELVPGARSVICCVKAYPPPERGLLEMESGERVAAYAHDGRDYHKEIRDMLFGLMQRLGIEGKCCCDTVPISDKHWAARAGLGWIGRHSLLITPRWGTWVNLGEIVTTEEVEGVESKEGKVERDVWKGRSEKCSGCNLCVKACPNHALDGGMLDVTRCTAYYNTHHQRIMPKDLSNGGYSLGCDICQLACPWNNRVRK